MEKKNSVLTLKQMILETNNEKLSYMRQRELIHKGK